MLAFDKTGQLFHLGHAHGCPHLPAGSYTQFHHGCIQTDHFCLRGKMLCFFASASSLVTIIPPPPVVMIFVSIVTECSISPKLPACFAFIITAQRFGYCLLSPPGYAALQVPAACPYHKYFQHMHGHDQGIRLPDFYDNKYYCAVSVSLFKKFLQQVKIHLPVVFVCIDRYGICPVYLICIQCGNKKWYWVLWSGRPVFTSIKIRQIYNAVVPLLVATVYLVPANSALIFQTGQHRPTLFTQPVVIHSVTYFSSLPPIFGPLKKSISGF